MQESQTKKLFQFEMMSDKKIFQLDDTTYFKIKHAWVENHWSYECIDNKAVIQKDTSLQFLIDAEYIPELNIINDYFLMNKNKTRGPHLGSLLEFDYKGGEDTVILNLVKKDEVMYKIKFTRKTLK